MATLRAKVEEYREKLREKAGAIIRSSENGPVGMGLIDLLVEELERQERLIAELRKQIDDSTHFG